MSKTKRDIEKRLMEIDNLETQIQFSADFLTDENKEKLKKLNNEKYELLRRLDEME